MGGTTDLNTSLSFIIITKFHMDLKPQLNIRHYTNSTAFTLHTMFDSPWTIAKPYCFDQVRLNAEVRWVP